MNLQELTTLAYRASECDAGIADQWRRRPFLTDRAAGFTRKCFELPAIA